MPAPMAQSSASPEAFPTDPVNTASFFSGMERVNWREDPEFLSGLAAILGPDSSSLDPVRIEDLTLRARCFYYSQKYQTPPIDFDAYRSWRANQPSSALEAISSSPDAESARTDPVAIPSKGRGNVQASATPDYPATFNEVMELIQSGKPIPGIKDIPDTVLLGQATAPSAVHRKKPWERTDATTSSSRQS